VAKSAVTAERFAKGMTFEQYVKYAGSPENLAREAFGGYFPDGGSFAAVRRDNSPVFRDRYAKARLSEPQAAAIKWLAAQPGGPAKILVISEDWPSDCRRDVPVLARLAEAGGMELRIFNRDGKKILGTRRPDPAAAPDANHDLMLEFMNGKSGAEWASVPVAVFYTADFRELHRYIDWGIAIILITGVMLFASEGNKLYVNAAFTPKMVLLAAALLFHYTAHRKAVANEQPPAWGAVAGLVSQLLWIGVGAAGRAIGFV